MYDSFARDTVDVMFLLRRRRLAHTVVSEAVRNTITPGDYAALILSAPSCIHALSQAARDRLACDDQPPVTLTDEQREQLQIDCLYRRFCHTTIGHHHALCIEAARACTYRFLARHLLSAYQDDMLLYGIADTMSMSVAQPTTRHHWIYHNQPSTALSRRRHSLSDLDIRACDCSANPQHDTDMDRVIDDLVEATLGGDRTRVRLMVLTNERPTASTTSLNDDGPEEDRADTDDLTLDYKYQDGDAWCM